MRLLICPNTKGHLWASSPGFDLSLVEGYLNDLAAEHVIADWYQVEPEGLNQHGVESRLIVVLLKPEHDCWTREYRRLIATTLLKHHWKSGDRRWLYVHFALSNEGEYLETIH